MVYDESCESFRSYYGVETENLSQGAHSEDGSAVMDLGFHSCAGCFLEDQVYS